SSKFLYVVNVGFEEYSRSYFNSAAASFIADGFMIMCFVGWAIKGKKVKFGQDNTRDCLRGSSPNATMYGTNRLFKSPFPCSTSNRDSAKSLAPYSVRNASRIAIFSKENKNGGTVFCSTLRARI